MERQPKDCQVGKTDVGKMFFDPNTRLPLVWSVLILNLLKKRFISIGDGDRFLNLIRIVNPSDNGPVQ